MIKSNFGQKLQKFGMFLVTSPFNFLISVPLLISILFVLLLVSPILINKAQVNTYSALLTLASINTSTILPSTTAFVLPPTLLKGIKPLFAITTTNTGHNNRELSNLTKIYTNKAKYNSQNDSFTFQLAIFYDMYTKANVLLKVKMKVFTIILKELALDYYYSNININNIRWNGEKRLTMLCNKIDKIDKIDEIVIDNRMRWPKLTFKLLQIYVHWNI